MLFIAAAAGVSDLEKFSRDDAVRVRTSQVNFV